MSKQQKPVHNHPLSLPEAYVANTQIATSFSSPCPYCDLQLFTFLWTQGRWGGSSL